MSLTSHSYSIQLTDCFFEGLVYLTARHLQGLMIVRRTDYVLTLYCKSSVNIYTPFCLSALCTRRYLFCIRLKERYFLVYMTLSLVI